MEICRELGFCCVSLPGLVRLNPNIPFKTRGNGAVVFSVIQKDTEICAPLIRSGAIGEEKVMSVDIDSPRPDPCKGMDEGLFRKLVELVDRESHKESENTEPGLVVTNDSFDISHYVRAVRTVYPLEDAKNVLVSLKNTRYQTFGLGRGIIGCLGALSWYQNYSMNGMDHSYELMAYRGSKYWNTPRKVDNEKVKLIDQRLSNTFNNYDYKNEKPLIYPNTPCPVLFGVRGNVRKELPGVLSILDCEEMERWQIFITNQGTDDHLVERKIGEVENYSSVITRGIVLEDTREIKGGHVFIKIGDGENDIWACAFEPTKGFREKIRNLLPGDEVRLFGGVKGEEKSERAAGENKGRLGEPRGFVKAINMEKMEILGLVPREEKIGNPRCPTCGKSMKSIGRNAGFRCRDCHRKTGIEEAAYRLLPRSLIEGKLYEVDGVALRHLAKPLARMGKELGKPLRESI